MTTSTIRASAAPRIVLAGFAAVAIVAAVLGGAYLWHRHFAPSQASAADCALAQNIIDQAQHLPSDPAAVAKWENDMHNLRMAKMKDGYLGGNISSYEIWAGDKATGKGQLPTAQEFNSDTAAANSHCATKLTFPALRP
jgi:hypothetical protein